MARCRSWKPLEDGLLEFLDGWSGSECFRLRDVRDSLEQRLNGDAPTDMRLGVELRRLGCEIARLPSRARYELPAKGVTSRDV